jgi:hypothetical protein
MIRYPPTRITLTATDIEKVCKAADKLRAAADQPSKPATMNLAKQQPPAQRPSAQARNVTSRIFGTSQEDAADRTIPFSLATVLEQPAYQRRTEVIEAFTFPVPGAA